MLVSRHWRIAIGRFGAHANTSRSACLRERLQSYAKTIGIVGIVVNKQQLTLANARSTLEESQQIFTDGPARPVGPSKLGNVGFVVQPDQMDLKTTRVDNTIIVAMQGETALYVRTLLLFFLLGNYYKRAK